MVRDGKRVVLPCILVVLSLLPGCSAIDDFFGIPRTVPEGSKVTFGARRTPTLNPGGDGSVPVTDSNTTSVMSVDAIRASDPSSQTSASANGRHVPVENGTDATADASMNAAPVASVSATGGSYPPLATVPPTPTYPPVAQNTADMKSLTAQRDVSESARQELMNNQSATVMTSPATGQLVDNPATAVAPTMPTASAAVNVSVAAPVLPAPVVVQSERKMPVENAPNMPVAPTAVTASVVVPAPPPVAPRNLMAPIPAPITPVADASVAAAPPAMEPVHLHPPSDMPVSDSASQQYSNAAPAASGPVSLVPPQDANAQTHYLSDSRYAARRAYVPADDSSY